MSTLHIVGAVLFGAITVAAGVLAAEELVRLKRKQSIWPALSKPAAQRFRICLLLAWIGIFFLTEQWSIFPAQVVAGTVMTVVLVWNVWKARRRPRPS